VKSEVNVAVGLSHLGNDTQFLTALPTDDIGKAARQFLVSHQVSLTQVKSAEGRVGIYFVEMEGQVIVHQTSSMTESIQVLRKLA
jgi:2-dehydro-3-deoxygluconokinase